MNRPTAVDLSQALDRHREKLANAAPVEDGVEPGDVLSYFGSWQDSIPRALILDPLLRPAAKITWQVLRTRLGDPQTPVLSPLQEDLARSANISRRTLSTSLLELRLQGWVTTGGQVRSAHLQDRGRFRAQTYLLHDRPLTVEDMIRVDTSYLELVSVCAHHSSRHLRQLAYGVLDHLRNQARSGTGLYADHLMPTMHDLCRHADTERASLHRRLRRRLGSPTEAVDPAGDSTLTDPADRRIPDEPVLEALHPGEVPKAEVEADPRQKKVAHGERVSNETKFAEKQQKNTTNDTLNILHTAESGENPRSMPRANFAHGLLSSSSCINNTTTAQAHDTHASAHTEAGFGYWLPKDLLARDGMPEQLPQIATALEAILEGDLADRRQAVLDEWAGCMRAAVQGYREPIGQPLRYLRGIALKARRPDTGGREGFHQTALGKVVAEERLASVNARTAPGGTLTPPSQPSAAQTDRATQIPRSPQLLSSAAAAADPGFLRHAKAMHEEWQQRLERATRENAPERVLIDARTHRDYWLNQVNSVKPVVT